jgi:pimeloyl-ACP methyl ester carboxylesterase
MVYLLSIEECYHEIMMPSFHFKKVDPKVLQHTREKRGFITAPLDYQNPDGEKIEIFYRLIPAYGSDVNDRSKPIVVVFNGGPGMPSHVYRPLDFDYENLESEKNGNFDRFKFMLKTHRVLLADQRGTDGQSAPLDLDAENLDGHAIAKYFSSDAQAKDYASVIEAVIPKGENFLIIAQSYGGMVGMQYLSLTEARKPKGILFTCSALPYEDIKLASTNRRQEQLNLNRKLKKFDQAIGEKTDAVRAYLETNGLNPNFINALYMWLGKSEAGTWEQKLIDHLDKILKMEKPALETEFKDSVGVGNVLNYILSSANFTPGETDRSLAEFTSQKIPFEPWMLDENWTLLQIGKGNPHTERVISEMDKKPPRPTSFLKIDKLKTEIAKHQLLFVSADNDAFVPAESFIRSYQKFQVARHTHTAHLPGGHHAIFLEEGHRKIIEWSKTIS